MRTMPPKGRLRQRIPAGVPESLDVTLKLTSTIRRGLFDLSVQTGIQATQEIFQRELDRLVGPRYRPVENGKMRPIDFPNAFAIIRALFRRVASCLSIAGSAAAGPS